MPETTAAPSWMLDVLKQRLRESREVYRQANDLYQRALELAASLKKDLAAYERVLAAELEKAEREGQITSADAEIAARSAGGGG